MLRRTKRMFFAKVLLLGVLPLSLRGGKLIGIGEGERSFLLSCLGKRGALSLYFPTGDD